MEGLSSTGLPHLVMWSQEMCSSTKMSFILYQIWIFNKIQILAHSKLILAHCALLFSSPVQLLIQNINNLTHVLADPVPGTLNTASWI